MAYRFEELLVLSPTDPRLRPVLALGELVDGWQLAQIAHALGAHPPDRVLGCNPPVMVAAPGERGNGTGVPVLVWDVDDAHMRWHLVTTDPGLHTELSALHRGDPPWRADEGRALVRALEMGLRPPGWEIWYGLRIHRLHLADGTVRLVWGTGNCGDMSEDVDG